MITISDKISFILRATQRYWRCLTKYSTQSPVFSYTTLPCQELQTHHVTVEHLDWLPNQGPSCCPCPTARPQCCSPFCHCFSTFNLTFVCLFDAVKWIYCRAKTSTNFSSFRLYSHRKCISLRSCHTANCKTSSDS